MSVQTYNVTLGNLAPGNEIYNVSIWFGKGPARQLGWFPYSLYSFASDRLPTPRGGLLVPVNGANFTLATGWVGKYAFLAARTQPMNIQPSCMHTRKETDNCAGLDCAVASA